MTAPGSLTVGIDVSAVPDRPAGAGRYVVGLVAALGRRDDVALVLVTRAGDTARWLAHAPRATLRSVVPPPRLRRLVWEQVAMPRVIDRAGIDVFHSPHYTMPELSKLPRVVTVHDMTFFDHPDRHERLKVPVFRRAVRSASKLADAVVCVSETTATRLRELHPPAGSLHVIHHGIDHDRFRPDDPDGRDEALLEALGVRGRFVAFLATLEPRKGIATLVQAFDRVAQADPEIALVLGGQEGWGGATIDDAISASPHRDRIIRPGWLPDAAVPALFRRAAAVVYPAVAEGFGLPVIEALACGAPVVTTRGTSMEEIAGPAAYYFSGGDAGELEAAIRAALSAHDGSRREAGVGLAAGFTWDRCADAHVEVYREAIARHSGRR